MTPRRHNWTLWGRGTKKSTSISTGLHTTTLTTTLVYPLRSSDISDILATIVGSRRLGMKEKAYAVAH
jgi:hypothetical protein